MRQEMVEETVAESGYRQIRADIIFGRLAPGQKLKLENLKGAYETSVSTLREILNRLTSEGLVVAEESGGKKTYALTDAGRAEAEAGEDRTAPWEAFGTAEAGRATALPKAGAKLAQAAAQVARGGTPDQVAQAVDVLDEARRKLYSILAQD